MAKTTKTTKANKAKIIAEETSNPIIKEENVEVVKEAERPTSESAKETEKVVTDVTTEPPIEAPAVEKPATAIAEKEATSSILKGVVVNCQRLNVRKEPSVSASVVKILNANTIIPIYEAREEWHKTKQGYVMAKFIKLLNND